MNGLDYAVIALVGIAAIFGLRRGALRMATSVVSLCAGIFFASLYYDRVARLAETQLRTQHNLGAAIGFVAVFALIFTAVEIIGNAITRATHIVHLGWADRLAGGILDAGIVAVVAGVAVMLMMIVLPADAALLRQSRLAPYLLAYDERLASFIPAEAKRVYERNRAALIHYWMENAFERAGDEAPSPAASPSPASK